MAWADEAARRVGEAGLGQGGAAAPLQDGAGAGQAAGGERDRPEELHRQVEAGVADSRPAGWCAPSRPAAVSSSVEMTPPCIDAQRVVVELLGVQLQRHLPSSASHSSHVDQLHDRRGRQLAAAIACSSSRPVRGGRCSSANAAGSVQPNVRVRAGSGLGLGHGRRLASACCVCQSDLASLSCKPTSAAPEALGLVASTAARSAGRWRFSARSGQSWCCGRSSTASGGSTTCGCAPAFPGRFSPTGWRTLVEHGVLRREPYQEPGARVRHEYRLTAQGPRPVPGADHDARVGQPLPGRPGRGRRWSSCTGTAASWCTPRCTAPAGIRSATRATVLPRPGPGRPPPLGSRP